MPRRLAVFVVTLRGPARLVYAMLFAVVEGFEPEPVEFKRVFSSSPFDIYDTFASDSQLRTR